MEGSSSSLQLVKTAVITDNPLDRFLSHLKAVNLTYTLLRSVLLVSPEKLDEVFGIIHGLEHSTSISKHSKTIKRDHPVLLYWQDKAIICESCTSFLSELLASSWRQQGTLLANQNQYHWINLNLEATTFMADVFKYMSAAYDRLEKETKDALQTESPSRAFVDATTEYFGLNFETTHNKERLTTLLYNLHESNLHLLLMRLVGGRHIQDTIEGDKKILWLRKPSKDEVAITLFDKTESRIEQVEPNPSKGKNYSKNRKTAERRKMQRLVKADTDQAEAAKDFGHLLEGMVGIVTSTECPDQSNLGVEIAACISKHSPIIEDINITHSASSTERVDGSNLANDVTISSTDVESLVKTDCAIPTDISRALNPSSSSLIVLGSYEEQITEVSSEDIQSLKLSDELSDDHKQQSEDVLQDEDVHTWTEVVGSRKKSQKSKRNGGSLTTTNNTLVDLGWSFKIAPGSTFLAHKAAPLQKPTNLSKTVPTLIDTILSTSAKSAPTSTVPPSTPQYRALRSAHPERTTVNKASLVSAVTKPGQSQNHTQVLSHVEQVPVHPQPIPNAKAFTSEDHPLPIAGSSTTKKQVSRSVAKSVKSKVDILPSVPETASTSPTPFIPDTHCNPTSFTTPTDLKNITPATTAAATTVDVSHCDTTIPVLPFRSESTGPATVSSNKDLKTITQKIKMSDTSETTLATTVTPLTDTFSLVESLKDAGVEDAALSSLIPKASSLTMSSTHLPSIGSSHSRSFAGKHLDVRRANFMPTSAGNSPIQPQAERTPKYNYPPPDVLTPENQEILDLIIKGPVKKDPKKMQSAANQEKNKPTFTGFFTKKPAVTTYEGKDAYEILGYRCPAPLTLKDHPNVNKCIRQDETFHCAYCRVEISDNTDAEKAMVCPGCGPCSDIRYCQRSHLLADSVKHFEICGTKTASYPLMWSELPLHCQRLYPYIKPLSGPMTFQCFRQMAHCLVINSDGIIQNPFKAYFETRMPQEDRVKVENYVRQMYQFQDHGYYYLFHLNNVAAGIDIEMTINMPDGSDGSFREDQRFARVRNACFLTSNPKLLAVFYRRIKDVIEGFPDKPAQIVKLMTFFNRQFIAEFPTFNLSTVAPLDRNYSFQDDWGHVRHLVHDLELGNPILRAWITEDAEDPEVPADPVVRYQGNHWDMVHGPSFRAGHREEWGPGWNGMPEKKWQKQLDRKYLKMVNDELTKIETELEGEII